jgi:alkylation response protein AidB-like acyl-CoA dehydrogenase
MDFTLPEEVRQLKDAIKKFLDREVLPRERENPELCGEGKFSKELHELGAKIRQKSVDLGYYTLHMPEDLGGGGLHHVGLSAIREEIAKSGTVILGIFILGDPPMGPTGMLRECTEFQKKKYLEPLMKGEKTTCFALTEPNAGSDVAAIETSAVRDGDHYVLNGSKHFISNGPYCDFAQVFAANDRELGMNGGISAFFVDADTPGFTRSLQRSMADDDFQSEFFFEDCRVPVENMIGKEGFGFLSAATWLSAERLIVASNAIGMAEYLLNLGVEYAKIRVQFKQPIAKFQAIQWMLADSATEIEAARWLTYRTAWLIDQGDMALKEVSMAKLFASEMCDRVADKILQVHGGMGYMTELPVQRLYRLARLLRIGGGTSEIQRHLIAKTLGL